VTFGRKKPGRGEPTNPEKWMLERWQDGDGGIFDLVSSCHQCFDAVGWVAARASGL